MSYYDELKQIHGRWLTNPGTSNGQLEDSQTILLLLGDIEKLEGQKSKWDDACKGHLERRIEVLEENIRLSKRIEDLEKNFELSAHCHSVEINKCMESIKFSDQSFREMEELFKSENKRVKELEELCANWQKTWDDLSLMNAAKNQKVFGLEEDNKLLREALGKILGYSCGNETIESFAREALEHVQQDVPVKTWKEIACDNISALLDRYNDGDPSIDIRAEIPYTGRTMDEIRRQGTYEDDRTCGCRGIPKQVCDICQGVTGNEKDKE